MSGSDSLEQNVLFIGSRDSFESRDFVFVFRRIESRIGVFAIQSIIEEVSHALCVSL